MRSSCDFIEIHSLRTRNIQLINKRSIVLVVKNMDNPEDPKAIITINTGERVYKLECEETYKDVADELLWNSAFSKDKNSDIGER